MNEPSWFGGAVNWTNFSHSLHTAGVDVMLTGHQHNYQRFLPSFSPDGVTTSWDLEQASNATYVDPLYMVTVVVGSPGCTEKIAKGFKSTHPLSPTHPPFFRLVVQLPSSNTVRMSVHRHRPPPLHSATQVPALRTHVP